MELRELILICDKFFVTLHFKMDIMFLQILGILFICVLVTAVSITVFAKDPWRIVRRKNEYIVRMTIDEYVDYAEWRNEKMRKERKNGSA